MHGDCQKEPQKQLNRKRTYGVDSSNDMRFGCSPSTVAYVANFRTTKSSIYEQIHTKSAIMRPEAAVNYGFKKATNATHFGLEPGLFSSLPPSLVQVACRREKKSNNKNVPQPFV